MEKNRIFATNILTLEHISGIFPVFLRQKELLSTFRPFV
jgi:hypothetical protein